MTRIKKRGLDYFPMDADFTRQPAIRRIMKKEGEGAAMVLIDVLCAIYSLEGYYVKADALFYEDIAAGCYERDEADVRRIIALAIDYGLFDAALYGRHGILTSVEIQQQFLHCTRRRVNTHLVDEYVLVADVDAQEVQPRRARKGSSIAMSQKELTLATAPCSDVCVTETPKNVTSRPHSIAKQSKITPSIPLGQGEVEADEINASPQEGGMTQEKIQALQPPLDGVRRNFEGLLLCLQQHRIPPAEQYAIIRKSNFGMIGHAVWKGISTLHSSGGKIKMPGRYLLSLR